MTCTCGSPRDEVPRIQGHPHPSVRRYPTLGYERLSYGPGMVRIFLGGELVME